MVVGENLVQQNTIAGDPPDETDGCVASDENGGGAGERPFETDVRLAGPYRLRYDTVKAAKLALEDDEWPKIRCHRHAMLLATKLLFRELWCKWNPDLVREMEW